MGKSALDRLEQDMAALKAAPQSPTGAVVPSVDGGEDRSRSLTNGQTTAAGAETKAPNESLLPRMGPGEATRQNIPVEGDGPGIHAENAPEIQVRRKDAKREPVWAAVPKKVYWLTGILILVLGYIALAEHNKTIITKSNQKISETKRAVDVPSGSNAEMQALATAQSPASATMSSTGTAQLIAQTLDPDFVQAQSSGPTASAASPSALLPATPAPNTPDPNITSSADSYADWAMRQSKLEGMNPPATPLPDVKPLPPQILQGGQKPGFAVPGGDFAMPSLKPIRRPRISDDIPGAARAPRDPLRADAIYATVKPAAPPYRLLRVMERQDGAWAFLLPKSAESLDDGEWVRPGIMLPSGWSVYQIHRSTVSLLSPNGQPVTLGLDHEPAS